MLGAAMSQDVGAVDRVAPGPVIQVRQQHVIADRAEPARHVAQFLADPRRVHQQQHRRIRLAALGMADEGLHRAILGRDVQRLFEHGASKRQMRRTR